MKNILVLGSSGFFGKSIVLKLKKNKKYKVFGISKSQNLDLTNLSKTKKFFKKIKPDVIINCAGQGGSVHFVAKNPAKIMNENIMMYLNIYEATKSLKNNPTIINSICNCVYTGKKKFQNEKKWDEGKVHPSVYTTGNIHRLRYLISKAWYEQYKVKSINLIFGSLFGPGDHLEDDRLHAFDGIILRMTRAHKKKQKKFTIYGSGRPIRECIFIEDAVKAMEIAIKFKSSIIEPINITNNFNISIQKIAKMAKNKIGFKGKLVNNLTFPDGDIYKRMALQSSRYKKYFYKLKYSSINQSIEKTIDYYLKSVKI